MKYVDEFRDSKRARGLLAEIHRIATRPWVLMEVCGGQTHAILRYGLDTLLPSNVELVHGPGCPVCVTPLELIDRAHATRLLGTMAWRWARGRMHPAVRIGGGRHRWLRLDGFVRGFVAGALAEAP